MVMCTEYTILKTMDFLMFILVMSNRPMYGILCHYCVVFVNGDCGLCIACNNDIFTIGNKYETRYESNFRPHNCPFGTNKSVPLIIGVSPE